MRFAAFIVIILTLGAKPCFSRLTISSFKPDNSKLIEASIEIIESCYIERISTVGLAGPSIGNIMKTMSSRHTVIGVVSIEEISAEARKDPDNPASPYKLQVFMITVIDSRKLEETLLRIKTSKWWNHMASFLLIDSSETISGCSNAFEILWTAWERELVNSKFLCLHPTRGTLIYTFNPYTSKAPVPWQQENIYKGFNGHPWTLFSWKYHGDESRCDALDFDKTLDLGGYDIRAHVKGWNWWGYNPAIERSTSFGYAQFLNVSTRLTIDPLNSTLLFNEPRVINAKTTNGTARQVRQVDISLTSFGLGTAGHSDTTYPHIVIGVAILTQYRGHKSQLEKLLSVLDVMSRFGVVAVLSITLLFFKFYMRRPMIPAILDLVRITANAALNTIPNKLGPRIYLGSLFIFVVTIIGIYSGVLSTLLTSNVRLKNINSIEDLVQSDYTIYCYPGFVVLIDDLSIKERLIDTGQNECVQYVLDDPKVACLGSTNSLMIAAESNKLHLSDKSTSNFYAHYVIRSNWPFEQRLNSILHRIWASGIQDHLKATFLRNITNSLESFEDRYQHQEVKVMNLKELGFAFIFLAIGLGCATITFIIEVAYFGKTIAEPRRRIRRRIRLAE